VSKKATAVQPGKEATLINFVTAEGLAGRTREVSELIARRAFEIFESNGKTHGNDLADWFRAESEILYPVHHGIAEAGDTLIVRAKAPGFAAKDLEVCIEPRRLTIAGQRERKESRGSTTALSAESGAERILRVIDLPVAVNPEETTATLEDDVLQVEMRKAVPADKSTTAPIAVQAVHT